MTRPTTLRIWKARPLPLLLLAVIAGILVGPASAQDSLEAAFENPPDAARPWVYWFWMNGNLTKQGVTADLEAMKRVGIGGTLIMNVSTGIPPGKVDFLSPEWRDIFKFAVAEANRLGIEIIMNNDDGWTGSGGPWNTVENSMQVITASETKVAGPKSFDEVLPQPKTNRDHYRDIAVWAIPSDADAQIKDWQGKAGYDRRNRMDPAVPADTNPKRQRGSDTSSHTNPKRQRGTTSPNGMIELTANLAPDGRLRWEVPEGNWTILRLGHTTNGRVNHPCSPQGVGLECDKLSKEAMDAHFAGLLGRLIADVGPLAGKTLIGTHVDSWEVGCQNWTPKMREEFKTRRGYDPTPYLPALAGRVVESPEVTERFLWDYRKTLADMMADNYVGHLRALAQKHGMRMSIEAYGGDGNFDNFQCATRTDIPMAEFWVESVPGHWSFFVFSGKWAASAAHATGRKIVGAESFTATDTNGKWQNYPCKLKALGDLMYAEGVNRFIFHRYAMQPWMDRWPGMTFGPWGTCIDRTLTWFDPGRAWFRYLARCQYLLQEGVFVGDICYFQGEAAPNEPLRREELRPPLPAGYDYDGCNDEIIHQMSVRDGRLTLPSGMSYRVLVLPETRWMTPGLLRKVRDLVAAGAHVVGPKPAKSPSLADYPNCDKEVARLADELWGDPSQPGEKATGQGKVYWGRSLKAVLSDLNVPPDAYVDGEPGRAVPWIHRRLDGADAYFLSNQSDYPREFYATFRVAGKMPELWDAATGRTEPAGVWQPTHDGRTTVALRLEPRGSIFVVFRNPTTGADPVVALARDGMPVVGAVKPGKIEIRKAVYGVLDDPTKTLDVTRHVAELAALGQRSIRVWSTLGGDPAHGVVKTLRLEYTIDGEPVTVTTKDGQEIELHANPAPQRAVAEVKVIDGRPAVVASAGGRYELKTASGRATTWDVPTVPKPVAVEGPWTLAFPAGWGAPESVTLDRLLSWPEHADDGVKYFSGTAVYRTTFDIPADRLAAGKELVLDLGRVAVIAEVKLNGRDLGILWKLPFAVPITGAAKAGKNELEVRVTNLWPNRLIGDERKPPYLKWNRNGGPAEWPDWVATGGPVPKTGRYTFTTWHHYEKDSPLLESGLLGPVTLRTLNVVPVPAN